VYVRVDLTTPASKSVKMQGGHTITYYDDGKLAFDSPTCVGVEQSQAPATKEANSRAQVTFGSSGARLHVDANSKLWIQAPKQY
jgi:hypothetical protein